MFKTCPKCTQTKGVDSFYKDKSKKDGLSSYCKECKKAASAKTPTIYDPEYAREYYQKNKDQISTRAKKWREDNIEIRLEAEAQRRVKNKDIIAEQRRNYDVSKKGRLRKRVNQQARSARLKKLDSDLSPNYWTELLDYYGSCCMKCGSKKNLTHDHIIPTSWGNMSSHTYMNSQILCLPCNSSKKNYWSIDFTDRSRPVLNSAEQNFNSIDILNLLQKGET